MSDSLNFEALKSDSYYSWCENMTAALILNDLWALVEADAEYRALEAGPKKVMNAIAAAVMKVKLVAS